MTSGLDKLQSDLTQIKRIKRQVKKTFYLTCRHLSVISQFWILCLQFYMSTCVKLESRVKTFFAIVLFVQCMMVVQHNLGACQLSSTLKPSHPSNANPRKLVKHYPFTFIQDIHPTQRPQQEEVGIQFKGQKFSITFFYNAPLFPI